MEPITEQDQGTLALAGAQFKYSAAREQQALMDFGLTGTRFWQEVNRIIDMPSSAAWDPHTVARLRRQRQQRHRPRVAGRII